MYLLSVLVIERLTKGKLFYLQATLYFMAHYTPYSCETELNLISVVHFVMSNTLRI